jgi:predicted RNA-binding protein with PUA-like domain
MKHYWLMKSEPDAFSIDSLAKEKISPWDGVRNYQARNMLRDEMKVGDGVLFYHSNCTPPGIAGIAKIVRAGYPDYSAFDAKSAYFDPTSNEEKPRWYRVDVAFVKKFNRVLSLQELREIPDLENMQVLRKGNRLSITPVTEKEWQIIVGMNVASNIPNSSV